MTYEIHHSTTATGAPGNPHSGLVFAFVELPATSKRGFTLVELLVVITVIVLLLALLAPAMDQAVYQAELAVCASKLDAIATGAIAYGSQYRRSYPHRPMWHAAPQRPIDINFGNIAGIGQPGKPADDRPVLRTFLKINDHLNCPLNPAKSDFDLSKVETNIIVDYALWFGFGYLKEKGMFRLGDRVQFAGDSFDLLASDWAGIFLGSNENGTHNDAQNRMESRVFQDHDWYTDSTIGPLTYTGAWWFSRSLNGRGPIDLNYARADGSVVRYDQVAPTEGQGPEPGRIFLLPQWKDPNKDAISKVQVPR